MLAATVPPTACSTYTNNPDPQADSYVEQTVTKKENALKSKSVLKLKASSDLIEHGGVYGPWSNISFSTGLLFRNLFIAEAGTREVKPDLVESYTVSDDGLVYEIILKDDLFWSDGEKLTVEDVVFSLSSVVLYDSAQPLFKEVFKNIKGANEFIARNTNDFSGLEISDNKLTITLDRKVSIFLETLAQFVILPKHTLEGVGPSEQGSPLYWTMPVVSGMYKQGEHIPGELLEYVYNDYYSETPPEINSIMLRSDYEINEFDMFNTNDVDAILDYRSIGNMKEFEVTNPYFQYLVFNIAKKDGINPVLSDVRVRQAIVHAIDFPSIVKYSYMTTATMVDDTFVQDVEKAKQLLKEAEYDFSRPLVLLYHYKDTMTEEFMNSVAEDLEDVGFTVEVIKDGDIYRSHHDHYDVGLTGLSAFDELEWYANYGSDSPMQKYVFGGEVVFDDLLIDLVSAETAEEKAEALAEIKLITRDLLYKFPLFTSGHKMYINGAHLDIPKDTVFGSTAYKYDVDFEHWTIKTTS